MGLNRTPNSYQLQNRDTQFEHFGREEWHQSATRGRSVSSSPDMVCARLISNRRRDLRLVELAVRRGADVFVRDKRGRRVQENDRGADERIKVFLRQCG